MPFLSFKKRLHNRCCPHKGSFPRNTKFIVTIYRNSHPITVTNQRFNLNTAYEALKHRAEFYSNIRSGWIIDEIKNTWINTSNYDPLVGSSYIPLLPELNNPMTGLINLKTKDIECFKWCHIRFINPQRKDADRIKKQDKRIAKT